MLDWRQVMYLLGLMCLLLGAAMGLPALADLLTGNPGYQAFALAAGCTIFIGAGLSLGNRTAITSMSSRQIFLLIAVSWLILPAFAALPLIFSDLDLTLTDALFEATSGLTTTGATVLDGLDQMAPGLLLWRSILQWLGGVGVVVMAVSALPQLRLGGMQIFKMEFSDRIDKAMPRATQIGGWLALVYIILTGLCAFLYLAAGMEGFDAINHAMTTVATGGFSTRDGSFSYYNSAVIEWVAILFMILGSLPFLLYVQGLRGSWRGFFADTQVRWFLAILITSVLAVTLWLMMQGNNDLFAALTKAGFNTTSLMTGTGYASANYDQWGSFVAPLFFVLMFLGACAGSTTCGLKIFRIQVLAYAAEAQLRRLLQPHAVIILYYNGRPLQDDVAGSVMGFFFLYVITFGLIAVGLGACGLDFITAASGAASAIANVGPGLGPVIGPSSTYESLPDAAKWIMMLGMLLGRLEIYTLLLIIYPRFWND